MEAAWALIFAMTAGFGALSWAFCRTGLASRIAEHIGFGDEPEAVFLQKKGET